MRNHTLGAIEIPEDVWWSDEFGWSAVEQSHEYGVTGSLVIDLGEKQSGRSITLKSNTAGGWVPRGTVLALYAQRAQVGESFPLLLADGREYLVMHDTTREFEAAPVRPAADMTADSPYRITLPLIEV